MNPRLQENPPRGLFTAMNQLYAIEVKLRASSVPNNLDHNVTKMKDAFEELGFIYEDPMGERFKESRTDLNATISGVRTDNLVVVEVVKPIIRFRPDSAETFSKVVQKGVVVVESPEECKR